METTVQTLAEFVLERLAEDEAIVRGVAQPVFSDDHFSVRFSTWESDHTDGDTAFVDRFDPSRVLAECAAKRQIVAAHPSYGGYGERCATCYASDELTGDPWPCETLRAIASVWADHPDYRDEWKP